MTGTASPTRSLAYPVRAGRAGLRRVLVGTDLSLDGDRAVRRAALLPLAPNADIVLVYVVPGGVDRSADSVVRGAAEARLEAAASKLTDWLTARGRADVTVAGRVLRGHAATELAELARRSGAEVLVVGRRGQSRLRRALMGSTSRRLVGIAPCAVVVVSRPPRRPYRRVVVGHDLSVQGDGAAALATRLAAPGAELTAVHAYEDPLRALPAEFVPPAQRTRRTASQAAVRERETLLRRALRPFAGTGHRWRQSVEVADARTLLLDAARQRTVDLVAVGTAGRSRAERLLVGSVAQWVTERALADVVVARGGALERWRKFDAAAFKRASE